MTTYQPTAASFKHGSQTLPGEYYTSAAIFAEEQQRIFAAQWTCVGRASRLQRPGDYFLADVAGESLIVLRDSAGTLRALFNVCRHRGTRLCETESGQLNETIQCPYHVWTYTTDGRLVAAPHMNEIAGFSKLDYPLHAAAIHEWEGFLLVNIAQNPQPLEIEWATLIGRLARFGLPDLVAAHRTVYDVRANWKLLFQNYSECLHCPAIHPQFARVLPYQSGANDLTEGPFLGGYMEISPPHASATMTGRACGHVLSDQLPAEDRQRAWYYTLMPGMLLSLHPDYANYYLLKPLAPNRTLIESEWLFHPDTLQSGNVQDAIEFWDRTNQQDWHIVEQAQLGVSSRRYASGPYSPRESLSAAWDREYLRLMGRSQDAR
jgi:phenylpropionate dioxygenase-like ring-hydroxylating dioxygenase large terminal subunit